MKGGVKKMIALVLILTVVIHMVYWRVIRHGVPHRTTQQAFGAWAVCFVIALVICGAL